jgi:hypothetical protein
MKPHSALSSLYLQLAKDHEAVARREKKYAEQARDERQFAGKDLIIAQRKNMLSRMDDDAIEYKICLEFYKYRMQVSNFHLTMAKKLRKLAKR